MEWNDPVTNWDPSKGVSEVDINRWEGNIEVLATQGSYGVDTGAANTYVVTPVPTPKLWVDGLCVSVKIKITNTGASTLNVAALGVAAIKKGTGVDVAAGDLKADGVYTFRFNGTYWILQGDSGNGGTPAPVANMGMIRDANGRAQVAAPSAAADIARKQEVDAVQGNLNNHTGSTNNPHNTTAAQVGAYYSGNRDSGAKILSLYSPGTYAYTSSAATTSSVSHSSGLAINLMDYGLVWDESFRAGGRNCWFEATMRVSSGTGWVYLYVNESNLVAISTASTSVVRVKTGPFGGGIFANGLLWGLAMTAGGGGTVYLYDAKVIIL